MSDEKEPTKSPPSPPPPKPSTKSAPATLTESDRGTRIEPPKPWPRKGED